MIGSPQKTGRRHPCSGNETKPRRGNQGREQGGSSWQMIPGAIVHRILLQIIAQLLNTQDTQGGGLSGLFQVVAGRSSPSQLARSGAEECSVFDRYSFTRFQT